MRCQSIYYLILIFSQFSYDVLSVSDDSLEALVIVSVSDFNNKGFQECSYLPGNETWSESTNKIISNRSLSKFYLA